MPEPEATAPEAEKVETETEPDWKAETDKWKALSRKNEATAKENAAAAKELAEMKAANQSEAEKANARAEAAEKELEKTRLEALRTAVALDKKLSPTQAKRLVGSTREELEADADELMADLKATTVTAPGTEGQGKTGTAVGEGKEPTMNELIRASRK